MSIITHVRRAKIHEVIAEMDRRGRVIEELEARLAALSGAEAPAQGWRELPNDEATHDYVLQYGGRCRDCADNFGVCESRGMPCDPKAARKAARHVIGALNYGHRNGFLPAAPAAGGQVMAEIWDSPVVGRYVRAFDHAAELASLRASLAEAERDRDAVQIGADEFWAELVAMTARAEAAESKLAEAVKRSTALEEGLRDLLAHLVAAVSLLKSTPKAKKAAPSNRMFDQMLADYEASIKRGRALAKHEGDGL